MLKGTAVRRCPCFQENPRVSLKPISEDNIKSFSQSPHDICQLLTCEGKITICKCIILCLKHFLENNISLEISGIFILQGFFVNHYNQSIYQKVSGRIQINLDKGRRRSYFLRNLFPDFISTIIIRSWSLYLSVYLSLYLSVYLSLYLHPSIANESPFLNPFKTKFHV